MHRLSLLFKAIMICFLTLAILIPLSMIRGTIAERQDYRRQAVASIAESYAGSQTLAGLVVVVPYRVDIPYIEEDSKGISHNKIRSEERQWLFYPQLMRLDGLVAPEIRKRGIHKVLVYELDAKLQGHFDIDMPEKVADGAVGEIGQSFVSFGIDDVRGLVGSPSLAVDGRTTALLQGPGEGKTFASGVHAALPQLAAGKSTAVDVALDFKLGGTEQLSIVPIGDNNRIELKSTWPSPEFAGRFLPHERIVSAKGFDAIWEISALAANTQKQYESSHACATGCGSGSTPTPVVPDANVAKDSMDQIELTLVDPVNIYTQADRASKYGLLFVLLTFVGFFMFETIKRLRIHPIQYLLAGLGLAVFFLLLISLSEHIAFPWAYLIASAACIGLLGFYLGYVLHSRARGLGFAAMLTALYAVLYGLLVSEDNALVLGSILLFAILAAIMLITRKIDWYGIGQQADPNAATQP